MLILIQFVVNPENDSWKKLVHYSLVRAWNDEDFVWDKSRQNNAGRKNSNWKIICKT